MKTLKQIRQHLIMKLWQRYSDSNQQLSRITKVLAKKDITQLMLDHFAVIDLPSPHTGIPALKEIFTSLGFIEQGKDYLACKQNDFLWLTEADSFVTPATDVLPQVVVADFRLDEMPSEIRAIIYHYANQANESPLLEMQNYLRDLNDEHALKIEKLLLQYFLGRDWPLPRVHEFKLVQEFNELLAWVLVFGRVPNHFTLAIHLLNQFKDLPNFHDYLISNCHLELNKDGGIIKGGKHAGIAQSSTQGELTSVQLADGAVEIPLGFVEFVWRYPMNEKRTPTMWNDYFTGFIAQHADHVIESLYVHQEP